MVQRITVLHLVPEDSYRGAQVYAGRLRDALAQDPDQCHLVVALFRSPSGALRPDLTVGRSSGFLRRLGLDPLALASLRRLIQRQGADIVVAHGGESLKYAVLARSGARLAYYKIGLSATELARPSRLRLYRFLVRRVTRGVGVSEDVRIQLRDVLGMPSARLYVVPNGRPPDLYHPRAMESAASMRPRVMFVGQLETGKRPELFVSAVQCARGRGIEFDAAMAGDGPLRAEFEDIAGRARVDLLGVRRRVPNC